MQRRMNRLRTFPTRRDPTGAVCAVAALGSLLLGCGAPETELLDSPMLLPEALDDWVREADPVIYDRETIFDYINGAGEVYRSYAFKDVVVARYENPEGLAVAVELFDMGNPADAYGVFSYAREQEEMGIGAAYERRGSVLCFWQDRFYVCVSAEQRDPDPGPIIEEAARGVSVQLPAAGQRPALVDMLPTEGLRPLSERFFHLHQTLNYHYYLVRENVLNLSAETDAVLGRYQPGSAILLIVDYKDERAAADALVSFRHLIAQNDVSAEPSDGTVGENVSAETRDHRAERGETSAAESGQQLSNTETWKFVSSAQLGRFVVVALNGENEAAVETLVESASRNFMEIGN